jgi:tetratricopeptide (TPR) repeat protein
MTASATHSNLSALLSNKAMLRYRYLPRALELQESDSPLLIVLGADTAPLAAALTNELNQLLPEIFVEQGLAPDGSNIKELLWKQWNEIRRPILLDCYDPERTEPATLAAQLLFHRDEFFRQNRWLVLLCDEPLYRAIQTQAFDFIFTASFAECFHDQRSSSDLILAPYDGTPLKVLEYQSAFNEWEAERQKAGSRRSRRSLLRTTFDLAQKAQEIFRLDEAVQRYHEALSLARQLQDKTHECAALGNMGLIYLEKGDLDEALKYHQQSLKTDRVFGKLRTSWSTLG